MIFETRKVKLETLSEYLTEVRQKCQLSVEDVARRTGVKLKFLTALETGKFSLLPADVYVWSFLKQLAVFYSLEPNSLIEQFKKERGIEQQLTKQGEVLSNKGHRYLEKIIITPKRLSLGLGLLVVVLTVIYVIWQIIVINRTPQLTIFEPQNRQVITQSFVNVSGQTDSGVRVTLNGDPVAVDSSGKFSTQLPITPGSKDLVFEARNRFDKTVTQVISVVGSELVQSPTGGLTLRLEFSGSAAVSFVVDGGSVQSVSFAAGSSKTIQAQQKILLSTSNAGVTRAFLNDKDLGFLGRAGESLKNIPFLAGSGNISGGDKY